MLFLIVATPLCLGGVHRWPRLAAYLLAALTLLLTLIDRSIRRRRLVFGPVGVVLGLALALTALQLFPLPAGALALVSKQGAAIVALVQDGPTAHPVSLAPAETLNHVAKLGSYLAFYLAAHLCASSRGRRERLATAVVGTGLLLVAVGVAQHLTGRPDRLLFFHVSESTWQPALQGTFVNPNHFGAFLCLMGPAGFVLGRNRGRPWFGVLIVATSVVAVTLAGSRSSVVALTVSYALLVLLLPATAGGATITSGKRLRRMGLMAAMLLAGVGLVAWTTASGSPAGTGGLLAEIQDPRSKFQAWREAGALVRTFPVTGVGRGAFEAAFTSVSSVAGVLRFPYLENSWLQAVLDWGVPGALALFILVVWAGVRALVMARVEPSRLGAFSSLVALGVHELGDFAIEIPGVAFPALALAAVALAPSKDGEPNKAVPVQEIEVAPAFERSLTVAAGVALLVIVTAIGAHFTPSAEEDTAALRMVPREQLDEVFQGCLERRPADYALHAAYAERLAADRRPQALRYLNRALVLNPVHPGLHLLAAHILATDGRKKQALLELRIAATFTPDPRHDVWPTARRMYPEFEDLVATVPEDRRKLAIFSEWLQLHGTQAQVAQVMTRIVALAPEDQRALKSLARWELAQARPEQAAEHLSKLTDSSDAETRSLHAELRMAQARYDDAARMLDALEPTSAVFDLQLGLINELAKAGKHAEAQARLEVVGRRFGLRPEWVERIEAARATLDGAKAPR